MKRERLIDLYPNDLFGSWYRWAVYPNTIVHPDGPESHYASQEYVKPSELSRYKASEVWFAPRYCGGSDYSGSAVERANFNILAEYHGKKIYAEEHGMYGSFSIYLRGDLYNPDIIEALKGLDDYPLISDDEMTQVEMNWQNEYWAESWAKRELAEEICEAFPYLAEIDPDTIEQFYDWVDQRGNGWEWEYCGTGATLIHTTETMQRLEEKLSPKNFIELGVKFTLAEDWEDYITSIEKCELFKAAAAANFTLKDENEVEIELPDWVYPNPNQIPLLLQDK